jgi:hypothetical protein
VIGAENERHGVHQENAAFSGCRWGERGAGFRLRRFCSRGQGSSLAADAGSRNPFRSGYLRG